jgi:hypothetical protein
MRQFYADFKMGLFIFVSSSYQKLDPKTRFLGDFLKAVFWLYPRLDLNLDKYFSKSLRKYMLKSLVEKLSGRFSHFSQLLKVLVIIYAPVTFY